MMNRRLAARVPRVTPALLREPEATLALRTLQEASMAVPLAKVSCREARALREPLAKALKPARLVKRAQARHRLRRSMVPCRS